MSDIEKYYKGENEIMKKVPVKYSGSATDDPFTPEAYKTIEKLEAENKRLREALESISKNTCCDSCQEASKWAKQALEETE